MSVALTKVVFRVLRRLADVMLGDVWNNSIRGGTTKSIQRG